MMRTYIIEKLELDTDGELIENLPTSLTINLDLSEEDATDRLYLEDRLADEISNMTGWCVYSFQYAEAV